MPLLIRGPGSRRASASTRSRATPTSRRRSSTPRARAPGRVDGRSLLPAAAHPERRRGRELLIEQDQGVDDDDNVNGVFYSAIRTARYLYARNASGETELYDLRSDPYQLQNLVTDPVYDAAEAALAARLAALAVAPGRAVAPSPRWCRSCRAPCVATDAHAAAQATSGSGFAAPTPGRWSRRRSGSAPSWPDATAPDRSKSGSRHACCAASGDPRSVSSPSSSMAASSACRSGCGSAASSLRASRRPAPHPPGPPAPPSASRAAARRW